MLNTIPANHHHLLSTIDHLLSTRQRGFRQGRSAANLHLLLLTLECSTASIKGKATAVVALNMVGACDMVWHAAITINTPITPHY